MVYRNDRDVVRVRPKPVSNDGKPKKEFQDRVLMKALDYLKKEVEKQAALLPVEARDA
jgi:hypothetical protein